MDIMTEQWGHLYPSQPANPEAPPPTLEEPNGHDDEPPEESGEREILPSEMDMLEASRAVLEAEREAILKLGRLLGCVYHIQKTSRSQTKILNDVFKPFEIPVTLRRRLQALQDAQKQPRDPVAPPAPMPPVPPGHKIPINQHVCLRGKRSTESLF